MPVITLAYFQPLPDDGVIAKSAARSTSSTSSKQLLRFGAKGSEAWDIDTWRRFVAQMPALDDAGATPPPPPPATAAASTKPPPEWVDASAFRSLCEKMRHEMQRRVTAFDAEIGEHIKDRSKRGEGMAYAMRLGPLRRVLCIGDVHSSVHALMQTLDAIRRAGFMNNDMRLTPGTTLIFLGDVINRGPYNLACLSLVFTLILRNSFDPTRYAHCVAGNHESKLMWAGDVVSDTLGVELKKRHIAPQAIAETLQMLPTALFATIGGEVVQFNHAAIDPVLAGATYVADGKERYDIKWGSGSSNNTLRQFLTSTRHALLLLDETNSTQNASDGLYGPGDASKQSKTRQNKARRDATEYSLLKWSDLGGHGNEARLDVESGRWEFGRKAVRKYLDHTGVSRMISGHQDLTQLGVFGAHAGSTHTEVFDLSVPKCVNGVCRVGEYMALKTSIAWESKPGAFGANCFVCLQGSDAKHDTALPAQQQQLVPLRRGPTSPPRTPFRPPRMALPPPT